MGIWPEGFDKDDVMWCNTVLGDYPHYLPGIPGKEHGAFAGWYLLNYKKPVTVSPRLPAITPTMRTTKASKHTGAPPRQMRASGYKAIWVIFLQ